MNADGHDELVRFECAEQPPASDQPRFVIVVPLIGDAVVLVYNRLRGRWELPGGGMEDGEAPAEAAARELLEETGQNASCVTPMGWATLRCAPDGGLATSWLYRCEIDALAPAPSTGETDGLRRWDGEASPDIDRAAVALLGRLGLTPARERP